MKQNELTSLANSAFINEFDVAIEKATRNNLKRITSQNIEQIHSKLLDVLKITSTSKSKYFDYEVFKALVNEIHADRKKRAGREAKKHNAEQKAQ
jgi:hypothetical protein